MKEILTIQKNVKASSAAIAFTFPVFRAGKRRRNGTHCKLVNVEMEQDTQIAKRNRSAVV